MSKSSKFERPRKPYPDFPLFPHATRRWAKKILGKLHYFGPWENPDAALKRYVEQRDDLQAGRTPRVQKDGLKLMDLVNRFLTSKRMMVNAGAVSRARNCSPFDSEPGTYACGHARLGRRR